MRIHTFPLLALLAALVGCTPSADKEEATGEPDVDTEICDNDADDDDDGDIDCDDADCATAAACAGPTTEVDCGDGADDDGDGDIDCDDSDCGSDPSCAGPPTETRCDDGLDDDGDGATDCDDDDCVGDAACAPPATEVNCADGLDDDGDRLFDCEDPDCAADAACAAPATETLCDDGLDDDGDGAIDCADSDCAADAACAAPATETVCDDGLDDDGDGAIDCADTDCAAGPACATPTAETLCDDGFDDDGDGATDCDDADCAADAACAAPATEALCDDGLDDDRDGAIDCDDADCAGDAACAPGACADEDLGSALGYGIAVGSTVGGGDDLSGSCNSSSGADEDLTFYWVAPADGTYTVTTAGSAYDTVLSILDVDCATELGCDDDSGATYRTSAITFTASEGASGVFLVDGFGAAGDYVLSVYRDAEYTCRDGVDEDGDGATDCDDSDCATGSECMELDCADGVDGDADGAIDCDDDDCADELSCLSTCADDDLGTAVGAAVATGTTIGGGNTHDPSCATGGGAEDVAFYWTAPADAVYTVQTAGSSFDAVILPMSNDCTVEYGCEETSDAGLYNFLPAGTPVVFLVDGETAADAGDYVLNIYTDREVDCDDGGDEDLDGAIDCADSECAAAPACLELTCDDGADDEGDALVDCLDAECAADAVCDTSLADYDLGSATGDAVATGDTYGMGDDWTPSCGSSYAEDVVYSWTAPSAGYWSFDLSDSTHPDTVLGIYNPDGSSLDCDDDSGTDSLSLVTVRLRAGQVVLIGIDGYWADTGAYSLAIYE